MAASSHTARPAPGGEGLARREVAEEPLARLAALFSEHGARLERLAAPLLRGSGSAAEDVVGDVVLRYAERLAHGAEVPADEPAYLAQMVRNRCLDLQRQASRWGQPAEHEDSLAVSSSSAEEVALRREDLAGMVEDLALLPARQRQAILDVSVGGLSHRDAALRDDATPETSKSLLARAVRNLRALQAARQAPCESVRVELHAARHRGSRPAEAVRRHLRVCPPCRLDDARLRGAAGRARLGGLLGGWGQWIAELLHGPALGPLSKSVAATVAVVAAVPLASGPDHHPVEEARGTAVAGPARVAAAPPLAVDAGPEADATPAPARSAPAGKTEVETDRVGAWRGLMADLDRGDTLDARSRDALLRWCQAAGEKGLVGTKALSERCPPAMLDTPKRQAKVQRVTERREKDAAARRRDAAAPAPSPTPQAEPAAEPAPQPHLEQAAAPAPPAPTEPEVVADATGEPEVETPTKDASGPPPIDMTPEGQGQGKKPDGGGMGTAGHEEPDGEEQPDEEIEKKPDPDAEGGADAGADAG